MIVYNLTGGLGNQLFQLFSTFSYALSLEQAPVFIHSNDENSTFRETYWTTFLKGFSRFVKPINFKIHVAINEPDFTYKPIPIPQNHKNINIQLLGYYQSYKYFDQYQPFLLKALQLKQQQDELLAKNNPFLPQMCYVSMHFRVGDYKILPKVYPILDETYYTKSLFHIPKNKPITVLYFCESQDIDHVNAIIEKLKYIPGFKRMEFKRIDDSYADWEQLLIMTLCDHNIIANSTFSWWGAYLNDYPGKIVCYPEKWFQPEQNKCVDDLCPHGWIRV